MSSASLRLGYHSANWSWLARHSLFWVAYLLLVPLQTNIYGLTTQYNIAIAVQWLPLTLLNVYSFLYIIVPCLLAGQLLKFWFRLAVWGFMFWVCAYIYSSYIVLPISNGQPVLQFTDAIRKLAHDLFVIPILIQASLTGMAASLKLWRHWYQKDLGNQQLIQETTLTELQLLKAQIHPHFLFNTLNNLYALTLKESADAPAIILKLSGLLHYMLDECNVPEIALQKEILAISSYIELEKLRYGKRLKVTLTVVGEVAGKTIPPLLLIPFVENAFKHGSSKQTDQAYISVRLQIENDSLVFAVANSKYDDPAPKRKFGGMGLTNVRKRLALLFPHRHHLLIQPGKGSFNIELTIPVQSVANNPKAVPLPFSR